MTTGTGLSERLTREEFCQRFKDQMLKRTAPLTEFSDGGSIAEYAIEAAPSYQDDPALADYSPEECADVDISYWED